MSSGPEQQATAAPEDANESPARDDGAVESSIKSDDGDSRAAGEESFEPIDDHPDTPDDMDEDAVAPRESVEAVPDDE